MSAIAISHVALYTGLNLLLMLLLSYNVVRLRLKTETLFGDGDSDELMRATRAHGNNAEYVPGALIALVILGMFGSSAWVLHLVGGGLLVSRLLHAWGIISSAETNIYRSAGALLTWAVYLFAGVMLVYSGIGH